jgi:hypothetical protein
MKSTKLLIGVIVFGLATSLGLAQQTNSVQELNEKLKEPQGRFSLATWIPAFQGRCEG